MTSFPGDQVGRFAIGDWGPRCQQYPGPAKTKVLYIRVAPWHLREMWWLGVRASHGTRCIEHLGKPANWGPCHLRQLDAKRILATRISRDLSGQGTKSIDEMKATSRRRSHQDKRPSRSMRWRYRVVCDHLPAQAAWSWRDLEYWMPGPIGATGHRDAWRTMSPGALAPRGMVHRGSMAPGRTARLDFLRPTWRHGQVLEVAMNRATSLGMATSSRGLDVPSCRPDEATWWAWDLGKFVPGYRWSRGPGDR